MARKAKTRRPASKSRARRKTAPLTKNPESPWPNIQWLIDSGGGIDITTIRPIGCVASATDEDICYAMLARADGESVLDLLRRLDQAIEVASETGELIDEINRR